MKVQAQHPPIAAGRHQASSAVPAAAAWSGGRGRRRSRESHSGIWCSQTGRPLAAAEVPAPQPHPAPLRRLSPAGGAQRTHASCTCAACAAQGQPALDPGVGVRSLRGRPLCQSEDLPQLPLAKQALLHWQTLVPSAARCRWTVCQWLAAAAALGAAELHTGHLAAALVQLLPAKGASLALVQSAAALPAQHLAVSRLLTGAVQRLAAVLVGPALAQRHQELAGRLKCQQLLLLMLPPLPVPTAWARPQAMLLCLPLSCACRAAVTQ